MTILQDVLLAESPNLAESYSRNDTKRELALLFRSLRKQAGLTQKELAARSGLSQSHISKMEAATGGLPEIESWSRYFHACGKRVKITPYAESERPEDELCVLI